MARSRLTTPSKLNLLPLPPGAKPPRFPVFVVPLPPQPTFAPPTRSRSLSGGSGVVLARLPSLKIEREGEQGK
ncbi:hypothetical protein JCM5296_003550 [Sporobolomyces johnsonii]